MTPEGPLGFDAGDERAPEPSPRPEPQWSERAARTPPGGGFSALSRTGKYVTVVVVIGLAVIAYVSIQGSGGVTARGLQPGMRMPPFAAPLATGRLEGDVNVASQGDQGQAGRVPACRVRGPEILNLCQLYERGPVVLAFAIARGGRCVRQIDTVQRVARRHPGVQFAAIALGGDRDDVRRLIRTHRWRLPVGYDHDGALAPLYGVIVCPVITYGLPGGRVHGTTIGELGRPQLEQRVRALEAAARRGGWSARR
jgi:hypothetical protein